MSCALRFEGTKLISLMELRVLLVPIGVFPNDKLTLFCDEIKRNQSIELQNLNQFDSSDSCNSEALTLLPNRNWTDGRMWFDFIDAPYSDDPIDSTTDSIPFKHSEDSLPSVQNMPWQSFSVFHRPMAVIALVHCPSTPDLTLAYKQYLKLRRCYPLAARFRCYAFEPLEGTKEVDMVTAGGPECAEVVLFPDTGLDIQHLRFYLSTCLQDMAAYLLMDIQRSLAQTVATSTEPQPDDGCRGPRVCTTIFPLILEAPSGSPIIREARPLYAANSMQKIIPSPHPLHRITAMASSAVHLISTVSLSTNNTNTTPLTTQMSNTVPLPRSSPLFEGRAAKYRGDLALLLAAPLDAIRNYKLAIELCAHTDDYLWHAGALEGLASATLAYQLELEAYAFFPSTSTEMVIRQRSLPPVTTAHDSITELHAPPPFHSAGVTRALSHLDQQLPLPAPTNSVDKNSNLTLHYLAAMLPSVSYLPILVEWLVEAVSLYAHAGVSVEANGVSAGSAAVLQIECLHRAVHYICLHQTAMAGQRERALVYLQQAASLAPVMSTQCQLLLTLESAQLARRLHAFRKYSWYLLAAERLCVRLLRGGGAVTSISSTNPTAAILNAISITANSKVLSLPQQTFYAQLAYRCVEMAANLFGFAGCDEDPKFLANIISAAPRQLGARRKKIHTAATTINDLQILRLDTVHAGWSYFQRYVFLQLGQHAHRTARYYLVASTCLHALRWSLNLRSHEAHASRVGFCGSYAHAVKYSPLDLSSDRDDVNDGADVANEALVLLQTTLVSQLVAAASRLPRNIGSQTFSDVRPSPDVAAFGTALALLGDFPVLLRLQVIEAIPSQKLKLNRVETTSFIQLQERLRILPKPADPNTSSLSDWLVVVNRLLRDPPSQRSSVNAADTPSVYTINCNSNDDDSKCSAQAFDNNESKRLLEDAVVVDDGEDADGFLYNPSNAHHFGKNESIQAASIGLGESLVVEAGQECAFRVWLCNPLSIALPLQQVVLTGVLIPATGSHSPCHSELTETAGFQCLAATWFQAYPIEVQLPANSHAVPVILLAKALRPGILKITGCDITLWNCASLSHHHSIQPTTGLAVRACSTHPLYTPQRPHSYKASSTSKTGCDILPKRSLLRMVGDIEDGVITADGTEMVNEASRTVACALDSVVVVEQQPFVTQSLDSATHLRLDDPIGTFALESEVPVSPPLHILCGEQRTISLQLYNASDVAVHMLVLTIRQGTILPNNGAILGFDTSSKYLSEGELKFSIASFQPSVCSPRVMVVSLLGCTDFSVRSPCCFDISLADLAKSLCCQIPSTHFHLTMRQLDSPLILAFVDSDASATLLPPRTLRCLPLTMQSNSQNVSISIMCDYMTVPDAFLDVVKRSLVFRRCVLQMPVRCDSRGLHLMSFDILPCVSDPQRSCLLVLELDNRSSQSFEVRLLDEVDDITSHLLKELSTDLSLGQQFQSVFVVPGVSNIMFRLKRRSLGELLDHSLRQMFTPATIGLKPPDKIGDVHFVNACLSALEKQVRLKWFSSNGHTGTLQLGVGPFYDPVLESQRNQMILSMAYRFLPVPVTVTTYLSQISNTSDICCDIFDGSTSYVDSIITNDCDRHPCSVFQIYELTAQCISNSAELRNQLTVFLHPSSDPLAPDHVDFEPHDLFSDSCHISHPDVMIIGSWTETLTLQDVCSKTSNCVTSLPQNMNINVCVYKVQVCCLRQGIHWLRFDCCDTATGIRFARRCICLDARNLSPAQKQQDTND